MKSLALALLLLVAVVMPAKAADFTITFTVPDQAAQGYIDDLAAALGYSAVVFDNERAESPNPVSKLDFIKGCIGQDLIRRVSELRAQREAAAAAAASKAASEEAAKAVTVK